MLCKTISLWTHMQWTLVFARNMHGANAVLCSALQYVRNILTLLRCSHNFYSDQLFLVVPTCY